MHSSQPDPTTGDNETRSGNDVVRTGRLEDLARQLAERQALSDHPPRNAPILVRLEKLEDLLHNAYRHFSQASEDGLSLSHAGEWLLDNFYLTQRAIRQIRVDMPKGFYRQLPKLDTPPLEGYPRIYELVQEVIRYCECRLDLGVVKRFVQAYQRVTSLTMGELWALPTMLRVVTLENLVEALASIAGLHVRNVERISITTPVSLADEEIIAHSITSLRTMAVHDWKVFFESVSHVNGVLCRDPANIYACMDFDTRDRYRKVVEELARATDFDEKEVSREAIGLSRNAIGRQKSSRLSHVGFYLVDAGRAQLESRLGFQPSLNLRLRRWLFAHSSLVYFGGISLLTLAILLGFFRYTLVAGGNLLQLIGTALFVLTPAVTVAINLVNWLITYTIPPRVLPKMEYQEGIPAEYRTVVVVPALLSHPGDVESVLQQMELHYLGNTDPHIHFALLTDFVDAPQQDMPGDRSLLELAKGGVQTLNQKYGQQNAGPFYLFHRQRQWNPSENCWMGWERKRGKLAEFNRFILDKSNELDQIPSKGERGDVSFNPQVGNLEILSEVKYIITLDADTSLPPGSANRLIATLAHPLNRAEFNTEGDEVVAGYTVLQPRMEIRPESANQSMFTRIFAGDIGLDLYTRAVSDVYQDFFGEGIYAGKGIYDVIAFERSLDRRVPENSLLSHDLFEGIHGRTGLVTDVTLLEDYPPNYHTYILRLHRWIRGDWQLLPWLLSTVPRTGRGRGPNDLSMLDRWKIVDNLRRSMLMPSLLALMIAGWLLLPGSALVWTLAGLLTLAVPFVTSFVMALVGGFGSKSLEGLIQSVRPVAIRWLLALIFLPHEALLIIDAIAATLVRLMITRKRLLQWTSAAHTIRLFGKETKLALMWKRMLSAPVLGLTLALVVNLVNPTVLLVATPLLLAWLVSPLIAHWISRPLIHELTPLSDDQRQQLRCLARRTWTYFEQFVGPDDHWLPPDHFQEEPRGIVAHRTSPTNLGLMLLSTLAAFDMGYLGSLELVLRLRATFDNMSQLERYRGHFLNWYDTSNLEPLPPKYVSTVDSGNLAACLLALKQGCLDLPQSPIIRWERWQGLLDTLAILSEILQKLERNGLESTLRPLQAYLDNIRQQVHAARNTPDEWIHLWSHLYNDAWQELNQLLMSFVELGAPMLDASILRDIRICAEHIHHHLFSAHRELAMLFQWHTLLRNPPILFKRLESDPAITDAAQKDIGKMWWALVKSLPITARLNEVGEICRAAQVRLSELLDWIDDQAGPASQVEEAQIWCAHLAEELRDARLAVQVLLIGYRDLAEQAEVYFRDMGFGFLFNSKRKVFHLGYNVAAEKLDSNCYDLLASEARIASLLAIVKGEVPQSHWLHLSRPLSRVDGARVLLSWNGSMFEYLMPSLLLRGYEGTLLDQSCRVVVKHQIDYGRNKGCPWGISESGYYRFDANMNYQYRGFGVPGLGFKRGLADDLVISPYASLLALSLFPQAVMGNIDHLIELEMLGIYGFYEAIDYTPSRMPIRQDHAIVYSYMAHHQGMILLSLANYLQDEMIVHRFHTDPRVRSANLLLQERLPYQAPVEYPHPQEVRRVTPAESLVTISPWSVPVETPLPYIDFLSNGRYGVFITNSGGGYSRWQGMDLTRWRADTTLDSWGTWVYVQDKDSGDIWSAGYQPTASRPESQTVLFAPHKAEFQRRDHDISLHMEITVPPEDDVEIRRLTLINHCGRHRHLMLTSYAEVVLAPQAVDQRHSAFNKLFVESEYLADTNALLFRRRSRSAEEEPIHLVHSLVVERGFEVTGAYESDRARFIGRGRTPRSPVSLSEDGWRFSGTTGATLDPIMSLSQEIMLEPYMHAQIAYITLAAESRREALILADRYQAWNRIERAFDRALTCSEREIRQLDLTAPDLENIHQLLSVLHYPHHALRSGHTTLAANVKGQSGLWAHAISGDYPILLIHIDSQEDIALVHELLRAHAYWRKRQIMIDFVILNQQETGYDQELQGQLLQLIKRVKADPWLNRRGGIFILSADQMNEVDRVLLETAARAVLDGDKGSLSKQLNQIRVQPAYLPHFVPTIPAPEYVESTPPLTRPTDLLFDNGVGGFSTDGREYIIYLEPDQWTPAPWINVISNPDFGFLVSETGLGYTWAENSGENRLTPWRNDPVTDEPGEALYLRDEETGQVWSPTPLPAHAAAPYLIRHGAGYSIFEHHSHGLKQRLRLFAARDAPVKLIGMRLENTWNHHRRITATYYAEWVLGTTRQDTQQYIVPEFDPVTSALLARNAYNTEFGERVAFLATNIEPHGLTADRTEFLERMGRLDHPTALDRVGLASAVKAGLDPCAAMQIHIELAPGETKEVYFLLGEGKDRQTALQLINQYQDASQVETNWDEMQEFWDDLLGTVTVQTPDPAMNVLMNRWLLYQTISCRLWGRSALYQSGGAFGYRDQLQDVMALVYTTPDAVRDHILQAARRQFEDGDVLHWWHPPSGRGVRTRCSDDLLWLPFVTAHYVTNTGDESILSEKVPFLKGDPLEPEEEERYGHYETSAEMYTLYEHCCRALSKGSTSGSHGLPLIGSGDWNDGMNRVGVKGQGESVWLGWFLCAVLNRFIPLCELMGDEEQIAKYRQMSKELHQALEANAWDGNWYRRAYYDDGSSLGSAENSECQIDSIAQSWAVLSKAANGSTEPTEVAPESEHEAPVRAVQAMESVAERLVRTDDQLVLLFTPPFDETSRDPGYIKGYPPGIRENGGQYTHAALWAAWAFAELGQGDRAEALFRMLNPVYHSDTPEKTARYKVEPYVVAADVYSVPPHTGRGGWTWYTGSAGWMYRLGLEAILGLRRTGKVLHIDPCIPGDWSGYELIYCDGETSYQIQVENPDGVNRGVRQVTMDEKVLTGGDIPLLGDGQQHQVRILMG